MTRVLHLGFNEIGSGGNTGVTLGAMFGGWPRGELLELHLRARAEVGEKPFLVVAPRSTAPIDGLIRAIAGKRLPESSSDGLNNAVARSGISVRQRLLLAGSALNDLGPVRLTGSWLKPVDEFAPQVVHSLLGNVRTMRLAIALSDRYDIPVAPHFMDDWPRYLFADGQLRGAARKVTVRLFNEVLRRSGTLLVIGEAMKREYESRYKKPCVIVGNSVDFSAFEDAAPRPVEYQAKIVRYIGGLHLGRAHELARVAEVLEDGLVSRAKLVLNVPLSDQVVAWELANRFDNSVVVGQTLTQAQVGAALINSDVLLFAESPNPDIAAFTRLSVSTKVPEYLASRRPVVAIGPKGQGSLVALRAGRLSWVVESDGEEVSTRLRRALDKALEMSSAPPLEPSSRVRDLFDEEATRGRLRTHLSSIANVT